MTHGAFNMTNRVFISSTFSDLGEYRAAVRNTIRRLGLVDIAMEHFGSSDERPKEGCLRLLREQADAFVGIYAHRYGFIPAGQDVSITEAEYNEAAVAKIPRFIYILDDDALWLPKQIEGEPGKSKLSKLKAKLKAEHFCSTFNSPDDLAAKVAADVGYRPPGKMVLAPRGHAGQFHQPGPDWVSPLAHNEWPYKVVAMDLDGTLLRANNFHFSWELIWTQLKFGTQIRRQLRQAYHRQADLDPSAESRAAAYREWCQKACQCFKSRKLTRDKVREYSAQLHLTKDFAEGIVRLRREGFVTALISGGISCFLEDRIPDFREYFDFVFINELLFDPDGMMSGVVSTEYDFQGKADALKLVCERAGCVLQESVFVGDQFNDAHAAYVAGATVAFPPHPGPRTWEPEFEIFEDDFEALLTVILSKR
jgi:phosphoserine phosphatase